MNSTSLDISKKIEPHKAAVLAALERAARELDIPFFVVGGAARDFIMQNGYGIHTPRVTHDVDIGVSVSSWDEFVRLIERLISVEKFIRTEVEHRYVAPTQPRIKVDILPFGSIAAGGHKIQWRQDNREMNVAGFKEAYEAAVSVTILSSPLLVVKIVSIEGLALLKLISWNDKPIERDRDAKDFKTIMDNYLEMQSIEDVYERHCDIPAGDYELFGARVLGREINRIGGPENYPLLVEILNRECDAKGAVNFVQQMQAFGQESTVPRDIEMLNAVYKGVLDTRLGG